MTRPGAQERWQRKVDRWDSVGQFPKKVGHDLALTPPGPGPLGSSPGGSPCCLGALHMRRVREAGDETARGDLRGVLGGLGRGCTSRAGARPGGDAAERGADGAAGDGDRDGGAGGRAAPGARGVATRAGEACARSSPPSTDHAGRGTGAGTCGPGVSIGDLRRSVRGTLWWPRTTTSGHSAPAGWGVSRVPGQGDDAAPVSGPARGLRSRHYVDAAGARVRAAARAASEVGPSGRPAAGSRAAGSRLPAVPGRGGRNRGMQVPEPAQRQP